MSAANMSQIWSCLHDLRGWCLCLDIENFRQQVSFEQKCTIAGTYKSKGIKNTSSSDIFLSQYNVYNRQPGWQCAHLQGCFQLCEAAFSVTQLHTILTQGASEDY
jgi:hypothetical protein